MTEYDRKAALEHLRSFGYLDDNGEMKFFSAGYTAGCDFVEQHFYTLLASLQPPASVKDGELLPELITPEPSDADFFSCPESVKNYLRELEIRYDLARKNTRSGLSGEKYLELFCPECGKQHIDRREWATREHKTHLCEYCDHQWRPFEYPTFGIVRMSPTTSQPETKMVNVPYDDGTPSREWVEESVSQPDASGLVKALRIIAKRPDLPNPERDADWKNCMKWSAHEAQKALEAYEKEGK